MIAFCSESISFFRFSSWDFSSERERYRSRLRASSPEMLISGWTYPHIRCNGGCWQAPDPASHSAAAPPFSPHTPSRIFFLLDDVLFFQKIPVQRIIHKILFAVPPQAGNERMMDIHDCHIVADLVNIVVRYISIRPLVLCIILQVLHSRIAKLPSGIRTKKSTSASINGYRGCRNMIRTGNTSRPVFFEKISATRSSSRCPTSRATQLLSSSITGSTPILSLYRSRLVAKGRSP